MLQRPAALVLATLVLALPIGGNAQIVRRELRFLRPSDAGTSPYLSSVDSSLSGYIQGEGLGNVGKSLGFLHEVLGNIELWRTGLTTVEISELVLKLQALITRDQRLVDQIAQSENSWLATPEQKLSAGFCKLNDATHEILNHAGDPADSIKRFEELAK